jgi:pimeloyl-ACP methyl ester carboxylesterase
MSDSSLPRLRLHSETAVWTGGDPDAPVDLWLLPGFGDSHVCFGEAFHQPLAARARIHVWDLPGHGASPPQSTGLTVARGARLLRDLVADISAERPIVLLAHSTAAVIAIVAAQLLETPPRLLINVEGNLTPEDSAWCRRADDFDSPASFVQSLYDEILSAAPGHPAHSYWRSLRLVDPPTLWSLCRSLLAYRNAGAAYLRLPCPAIYYWSSGVTSRSTQRFLAQHQPTQRRLDGMGQWPMVKAPAVFYRMVDEDVERHLGAEAASALPLLPAVPAVPGVPGVPGVPDVPGWPAGRPVAAARPRRPHLRRPRGGRHLVA